jgi:hypothetical protein
MGLRSRPMTRFDVVGIETLGSVATVMRRNLFVSNLSVQFVLLTIYVRSNQFLKRYMKCMYFASELR